MILSPRNRGVVLDVVVFCVNVIFMIILTRLFTKTAQQAQQAGDNAATILATASFCLSAAFLQPIGAILKRRSARQRKPGLDLGSSLAVVVAIVYFVSQLLFLISGTMLLLEAVKLALGKDYSTPLFGVLFLGIPSLAIGNTAIVLFYFYSPRHEPLFKFLNSPQSEAYGDVCLFLNMICFQMLWGYLAWEIPKDFDGIGMRIFTLCFTAALIYFPPRLFYLAEEAGRRLVWLTMLLSNAPIILHVLFGKSFRAVTNW